MTLEMLRRLFRSGGLSFVGGPTLYIGVSQNRGEEIESRLATISATLQADGTLEVNYIEIVVDQLPLAEEVGLKLIAPVHGLTIKKITKEDLLKIHDLCC